MRDRFYKFMQGRYGNDQLSRFTLIVSLVLVVLSAFTAGARGLSALLDAAGLAGLVITYFRMFSRNISARAAENRKFLETTAVVRRWFGKQKYLQDQRKTNHIYKCPQCGQMIRVPKGKGKIEIRCPKCQNTFIKKS